MKITIIGAGNVGATSAMRILESGIGDVVLIDIAEGIAKGKAEDLMDAASLIGHKRSIIGTSDYRATKDSDIIILTAGFARVPGMTREELLDKNISVVESVTENFMKFSKNPIVVAVTNPLDIMAYLVYKKSGLEGKRVIGMAGCLDSSRMNLITAKLFQRAIGGIDSVVLGTHGETMVPLAGHSKVDDILLSNAASQDKLDEIYRATKSRGAEIVSFLGTGSAFFAPSAGVFRMAKAIAEDTKEIFSCSCLLHGEYGIEGIFIGVPVMLGRNGAENIIQLPLSQEEQKLFHAASQSVQNQISKLKL
jgi:malate dehydrogenase